MKKILSVMLIACMVGLSGLNALADGEKVDSAAGTGTVNKEPEATPISSPVLIPATETAPTSSPVSMPATETEPTSSPVLMPETETTPLPVPTLAPTPEPTSTPVPAQSFFYCMKNGSEYAYIKDGDKVIYEPMIANNGLTASPRIFDDRSYLPFRYLFMSMLGFTEKKSGEELGEKQFTYYGSGNDFTIEFKINNEVKTLTMDGMFTYDGTVMNELKLDNGVSYVPLRYFEENNLCRLNWDDSSKSILLADSAETMNACFNMVRGNLFNDNYTTYSDIITNIDGNVVSIGDITNTKAYSASSNFNLVIYSNEAQKACYMELNKGMAVKELDIFDAAKRKQDLLIDRLVICGDKIYGLAVSEETQYTGTLFSARLSADILNNNTGEYRIKAVDCKEIVQTHGVMLFNINTVNNDVYCYYVDAEDGYSLRRLNVESGENIPVTADGKPIKNADYFSIGTNHIVYNDFSRKTVRCGSFDGKNAMYIVDIENVDSVKFINYDNKNNKFFYVSVPSEGSNIIKSISTDEEGSLVTEDILSAEKIRNLSIINGVVYAKVNNELKRCN